jgi:large subunit ribosomal protein L4
MGLDDVLIVTDTVDDNLRLSARNLPNVSVVTPAGASPLSYLQHSKVLMTKGAVAKIEEIFG